MSAPGMKFDFQDAMDLVDGVRYIESRPIRRLERYKEHQKYYVDGQQVPSASVISKIGCDTYGLMAWKENCLRKGIDPDKVRDEAAAIGEITHFRIQAHIEGFEPDFSDYTDEEQAAAVGPFEQAIAWWEKQDLTFVAAERQLVSQLHRYGGTVDMICRNADGLVIIDWKTSSQIRPEHRYQIAGYEHLVRENMGQPVARRAVVRVSRDGRKVQRNPWISGEDAEAYWAVFQSQLALYYTMQEAAE